MSAAPLEAVLSRLEGVRRNGDGYMALCPAHEDRDPSLSVREGDNGGVLLHCFAGCEIPAVVEATGLEMRDLFPDSLTRLRRPQKAATGTNGGRRGKGTPGPVPGITMEEVCAESGLDIVCLADIKPEVVRWLWPPYIAKGKMTILGGTPGLGKTHAAIDIAAHVSTGTAFPGGFKPDEGHILILTGEDGLADTIRPRLDAAGADVSNVHAIRGRRDAKTGEVLPISLGETVDELERVLNMTEADLLIVDPLNAFLPRVDTHRDADVRVVLSPIAAMLERTGCAGLFIHHLNKDSKTFDPTARLSGSIAFGAAARSICLVTADPDDETGERRLFIHAKSNLKRLGPSFGFTIDDDGIEWDDEPVTVTAREALGDERSRGRGLSTRHQAARDLILNAVEGGETVPSRMLERRAAQFGISVAVLKKARTELKEEGVIERVKEDFVGAWAWRLADRGGE